MTTETDKLVEMAQLFHDTYEALAPAFGYETRPDTKAFDPESPNGKLMCATVAKVRTAIIASLCGDVEPVAHMWQHDETGRTGFVEHAPAEELEQWERINKPRRFVAKLYSASTVAALKAEQAKDAAEDAELLEWLEEKHYALHPIKEDQGDDTYTLWWQVTDKDKSISGHPLGNIRAAIRAAIAAKRKA